MKIYTTDPLASFSQTEIIHFIHCLTFRAAQQKCVNWRWTSLVWICWSFYKLQVPPHFISRKCWCWYLMWPWLSFARSPKAEQILFLINIKCCFYQSGSSRWSDIIIISCSSSGHYTKAPLSWREPRSLQTKMQICLATRLFWLNFHQMETESVLLRSWDQKQTHMERN